MACLPNPNNIDPFATDTLGGTDFDLIFSRAIGLPTVLLRSPISFAALSRSWDYASELLRRDRFFEVLQIAL